MDITVDFSYGEGKAPNGYETSASLPFIEATSKVRLVPCMAFFGANASGKTNILKAAFVFRQLVEKKGPAKLADFFDPNRLNDKYQDTTFSAKFILNGNTFIYSITYNSAAILDENLEKNGEILFNIRNLKAEFSKRLFTQAYRNDKLMDILRVECSDGEGRQTTPFLNRIGVGYQGLNKDLKDAYSFITTNIIVHTNEGSLLLPLVVEILASTLDGNKEAAMAQIIDIIRRLDIDINTIQITERELSDSGDLMSGEIGRTERSTGKQHAVHIAALHKNIQDKDVVLDFIKHESAGTQRLAGLVGLLLFVLKTGRILFVDELECSLHPLLMRELVALFKQRHRNEKGAQLIFTTHNTDILDDSILRVSEIALVRKNLANGTMIRRLVDLKNEGEDIRNVTNFRKQYLDGFYSGIPHPAI